MDGDLKEMLEKSRILDVLHRYCRGIDRCDAALLKSVYHPDAQDEHGIFSGLGSEFIDFVIPFMDKIGPTSHVLTNWLIDIRGDIAYSESYVTAYHGDVPDQSGALTDLIVGGRYIDRFEKRNGEWRIAHRQCLVDWNQNLPASSRWEGPLHGQYQRGNRGSSDPSYQLPCFGGKRA